MSPCQGNALPLRQLGLNRFEYSYYNKYPFGLGTALWNDLFGQGIDSRGGCTAAEHGQVPPAQSALMRQRFAPLACGAVVGRGPSPAYGF